MTESNVRRSRAASTPKAGVMLIQMAESLRTRALTLKALRSPAMSASTCMRMAAQSGSANVAKCLRITAPAPSDRMGLPFSSRRMLVQPATTTVKAKIHANAFIRRGVWR